MGNSFNSAGIPAPLESADERNEWVSDMNTVLYFSATGAVFETRAYSKADIHELVRSQGLQCFTSADKQFDFWFSPSTARCQRRVNRVATANLLLTTTFTAKTVPLLRGSVVVATHDSDGDLDGLSWQQLDLLAQKVRTLTKHDEKVLLRRMDRDERQPRRTAARTKTTKTAPVRQATTPVPVRV